MAKLGEGGLDTLPGFRAAPHIRNVVTMEKLLLLTPLEEKLIAGALALLDLQMGFILNLTCYVGLIANQNEGHLVV